MEEIHSDDMNISNNYCFILDLPNETMHIIISELDFLSCIRFSQTCKKMKNLSSTNECWKRIIMRSIGMKMGMGYDDIIPFLTNEFNTKSYNSKKCKIRRHIDDEIEWMDVLKRRVTFSFYTVQNGDTLFTDDLMIDCLCMSKLGTIKKLLHKTIDQLGVVASNKSYAIRFTSFEWMVRQKGAFDSYGFSNGKRFAEPSIQQINMIENNDTSDMT